MVRHARSLTVFAAVSIVVIAGLTAVPGASASTASAKTSCTVIGTSGDDILRGTAGDDVICGFGGDDVIRGLGGDDTIDGGPGDDRVWAGKGDDVVIAGPGDDDIRGGPGVDHLNGGSGADDVSRPDASIDLDPNQVYLTVNYNLPEGTEVVWKYHPPSGNCLVNWNTGWTDHVGAAEPRTHFLFRAKTLSSPSCALQKSYGQWVAFVTTPTGGKVNGVLPVTTTWDPINLWGAEASCSFDPKLGCSGGSAKSGKDAIATPSVFVGPFS